MQKYCSGSVLAIHKMIDRYTYRWNSSRVTMSNKSDLWLLFVKVVKEIVAVNMYRYCILV